MGQGETDVVAAQIRRQAIRLFANVGFGSANVDEIAAASGVGVATLYRRWSDKSALANHVFAIALDDLNRRFPSDLPAPSKRAFFVMWDALWGFASEDPDRFVFLESHGHDAWISSENRAAKLALNQKTAELFERVGVRADPALAHALLVGSVSSVLRSGDEVDPRDLGERLWQALRTLPK